MNPKRLIRRVVPKKAIHSAENTYRKSRAVVNRIRYNNPAKDLKIIAITGTNGKTSTCNFLNDMLKTAGLRTALFTTAVIEMNGDRQINTTHRTVPLTSELFRFFKNAQEQNVDVVILETTSHALDQHKIWNIPIDIALITNLTQDHLDYHGTMESYASAKAKLFNGYLKPRVSILNHDDQWYDFFRVQASGDVMTYGKNKDANVRLSSVKLSSEGVHVRIDHKDTSIIALCPLIGEFNAYNVTSATSICIALGIDALTIRKGLEAITQVPGRMEMIRSSKGFSVIVDYAHTPDALEKALEALRSTTRGKVSVVFGATGNRDKSKRPVMGEIASRLADHVYLTDDETYTENGSAIRRAVMEGITAAGGAHKTTEIEDRELAIKSAILSAKRNDMILVAGLGHQDYRAMNNGNIPWKEAEIVKKILRESHSL